MTTSSGRVRLVVLPGLHGTGALYPELVRELAASVEPVLINYPFDRVWDYAETFAFVVGKLPDGPFAVLGDSYSGPLAVMVAAAFPERVSALILAATFITNPIRPILRWTRLFAYAPFIALLPYRPLLAAFLLNATEPREQLDRTEREVRSVERRVLAARLRAAIDGDHRAIFRALRLPTLHLRPGSDRVIAERAANALRVMRPQIEVVDVDAPHAVLITRPRESAAIIARFLRGR